MALWNFEKPADFIISAILGSSAGAPKVGPFSLKDARTYTIDDTEYYKEFFDLNILSVFNIYDCGLAISNSLGV